MSAVYLCPARFKMEHPKPIVSPPAAEEQSPAQPARMIDFSEDDEDAPEDTDMVEKSLEVAVPQNESDLSDSVQDYAKNFRRVYGALEKTVKGNVSEGDIAVMIAETMKIVEKLSRLDKLSGIEKRTLALDVVKKFMKEHAEEHIKDLADELIQSVGSSLIDVIVAASKGQFEISEITAAVSETASSFWSWMCCH